jgi:glycosyltransferase involved in cell wall biosynthesis
MKKIVWITSENFIDVDMHIIPHLVKRYDFTWIVTFAKYKSSDYQISDIIDFCEKNQINYYICELLYRFRNLKIILKYICIIKQIKKQKSDIIYVNMLGLPYLLPLFYLFLPIKKIIYAVHDVINHIEIDNRTFMNLYQRFICRCFKNFQVYSKSQLGIFMSEYRNKNVLYAPLYLKDYGESSKLPPLNCVNFLFFGRISGNKGLEFLIDAGNRLSEKYKGLFKIVIAGYTHSWNDYECLIKDKSVFDINIAFIPNDQVADLFCSAHYIVLPYKDVTQSGALAVAFKYNTPAIVSNLEGFKEYIEHEKNGFSFETENPEALAHLMEKIITTKNSGYLELKSNLEKFVEKNISIRSIVSKYNEFFDGL